MMIKKGMISVKVVAKMIPFCNSFYVKGQKESELLCGQLSDNLCVESPIIYQWFCQHFLFYSSLHLLGRLEDFFSVITTKGHEIIAMITNLRSNIAFNASTIVIGQVEILSCLTQWNNLILGIIHLPSLDCLYPDDTAPRLTRGYNLNVKRTVLPMTPIRLNVLDHIHIALEMNRGPDCQECQKHLIIDTISVEERDDENENETIEDFGLQNEDKLEQLIPK
jgi:hypothetical protein